MKVIGFDTETTGLKVEKGHRIIELAMLLYAIDPVTGDMDLQNKWVERFNPGRSIDPKAQEVHGISMTDLEGKPSFEARAQSAADFMNRSELIVAHNLGFDVEFLVAEFARAGVQIPQVAAFDTLDARWATPTGKAPSLKELCFALKVPYDDALAHAAEYDVDRMMRCLSRGVARGFFSLVQADDSAEAA